MINTLCQRQSSSLLPNAEIELQDIARRMRQTVKMYVNVFIWLPLYGSPFENSISMANSGNYAGRRPLP